eukprot:gene19438-biopygen22041
MVHTDWKQLRSGAHVALQPPSPEASQQPGIYLRRDVGDRCAVGIPARFQVEFQGKNNFAGVQRGRGSEAAGGPCSGRNRGAPSPVPPRTIQIPHQCSHIPHEYIANTPPMHHQYPPTPYQ